MVPIVINVFYFVESVIHISGFKDLYLKYFYVKFCKTKQIFFFLLKKTLSSKTNFNIDKNKCFLSIKSAYFIYIFIYEGSCDAEAGAELRVGLAGPKNVNILRQKIVILKSDDISNYY